MKRIVLLTMAAASFAQAQVGLAQKFGEPAADPAVGVVAPAPSPNTSSRSSSRKATAPSAAPGGGLTSGMTYFSTGSKGDSIPPVVIRFSQPEAKVSAGLEEDLFVMARVISRTLERAEGDKVNYKLGVPMLLTGSGRSVRPMYIEGLGPLFMIKVNFALMLPPKAEERKTNAPAADTEWDEAHRDVFGNAADVVWAEESSNRSSSYNEDQVELLKKELIGSLKNAGNIRGLKPDEFVNIAVFGHAPPLKVKTVAYGGDGTTPMALTYDTASASRGSVLTFRAKKSDIDAFASGKLDADAFKTKVTMTAYSGSGISTTSINSWIQESGNRIRQ